MTSRTRKKHARQLRRAERRREAAALRARLALEGKMTEQAKTNDLAILRRLVAWAGV